jgi:hypothetical protein
VDWPRLVRKYVWDEARTPYLVRVDRLTTAQARSELFVYAFLLAVLAAIVAALALAGDRRIVASAFPFVGPYALSLLGSALVLGGWGHPLAAGYCATAPVVTGVAALAGALRPDMAGAETLVLVALSLLWLGYSARIIRVARRLHERA